MASREEIVASTAKMFVELGIKSIRMDDIAHELGISKRTLYEMFTDKEELLYLSIKHTVDTASNNIVASYVEKGDSFRNLFESFSDSYKIGEQYYRFFTNLQKFYPAVFERIRSERIRENAEVVSGIISRYIDLGLISSRTNIRLSVAMLSYTLNGVINNRHAMALPEGVTPRVALMYTIINFFRGIATIEGMRQIDELLDEWHYKHEKLTESNNVI